jgi:hypothetical protein
VAVRFGLSFSWDFCPQYLPHKVIIGRKTLFPKMSILEIPRKGEDASLLQQGLSEFGFRLEGRRTHDELDAVTSALVGYYYLADDYEAIGAEDEGYMIIPRVPATMRWTGEGPLCDPLPFR